MDPLLTVNRVKTALDTSFSPLIDLSDVSSRPAEDQRQCFLSRAVAAQSLRALTNCTPEEAASAITDGYSDQGIDAIFFDVPNAIMYFVTAKWSNQGTKTIKLGDVEKFLSGIQKVIQPDFSEFNEKVRSKKEYIEENLLARADVKVVLVVAHCGDSPLGDPIVSALESFITRQNNVGEESVFSRETFGLERLYKYLAGSSDGGINLPIVLHEWGTVSKPYRAYYGMVQICDVAKWRKHGRALFHSNLRYFRSNTEVNEAIGLTLDGAPEHFWYFNNGITILCNSLDKTVEGGDRRDHGTFDCKGVSVVNGAQTVGVVWEASKDNDSFMEDSTASVHARIISLRDCPDGFVTDVTRAANTQNPIRHRDFAALDPEQHRLAREMKLDGKRYSFKSGDQDPKRDEGCNIEQATVALACSSGDLALAVQAKRELGQLWVDIQQPPYTTLFNKTLEAPDMWRRVQVMYAVEDALESADTSQLARGDYVRIHGNRFILYRVFNDSGIRARHTDPIDSLLPAVREVTLETLARLSNKLSELYPTDYIATLFKNLKKNRALDSALSEPANVPIGTNLSLDFDK